MAECILMKSGGGTSSDEVTTTRANVLEGTTTITNDSGDEIVEGTMLNRSVVGKNGTVGINSGYPTVPTLEGLNPFIDYSLDGIKRFNIAPPFGYYGGNAYVNIPASRLGNVPANRVMAGYTFTSENGLEVPGTMTVASITNFSVAVATQTVTAKWTVPTAATGKIYGGIVIRYKTGSYPTSPSDGSDFYTGANGGTTPGGNVSYAKSLSANTTYYFRAWFYGTVNNEKVYSSNYKDATCTTGIAAKWMIVKTSGNVTIPIGYNKMDVYVIGGGSSGAYGNGSGAYYSKDYCYVAGFTGGASGYLTKDTIILNKQGGTATAIVGTGGATATSTSTTRNAGSQSKFVYGGKTITAEGGSETSSGGAVGAKYARVRRDLYSPYTITISHAETPSIGAKINNIDYMVGGGGGGAAFIYVGNGNPSGNAAPLGTLTDGKLIGAPGNPGTANTGSGGGSVGGVGRYTTSSGWVWGTLKYNGGAGGSGVILIYLS